jgi:hypothetical protein
LDNYYQIQTKCYNYATFFPGSCFADCLQKSGVTIAEKPVSYQSLNHMCVSMVGHSGQFAVQQQGKSDMPIDDGRGAAQLLPVND